MKKSANLSDGLTLTELLIVMSIIAFLAIVALASFRNQIFKGKDARRKGDLKTIQIAVEEYEKDHDCYPLPQSLVCSPGAGLMPYLSKIPCDPDTGEAYFYEHENSPCPSWYRLYSVLENKQDVDTAELICQNGCGPGLAFNYYAASPNATAPENGGSGPTPAGATTPPLPGSSFYGCRSGVCVPISWDPSRPGPECDPSYQNATCYGQCGKPETECDGQQ